MLNKSRWDVGKWAAYLNSTTAPLKENNSKKENVPCWLLFTEVDLVEFRPSQISELLF